MSTNSDEDNIKADAIKSQLERWIELLVNHIDMFAKDGIQYVSLLRSYKGLKVYRKTITTKVSELCGKMLKFVENQNYFVRPLLLINNLV